MGAFHHAHENERVLYRTRLSFGGLMFFIFQGIEYGGVAGLLAGLGAGVVWETVIGEGSMFTGVLVASIVLVGFLANAIVHFRGTIFTVTTERMLYHHYPSFFRSATQTVRWETYQESVFEGGPISALTNGGTLTIRHGSADAERILKLASLPWAQDLKHYLDKIQSLKSAKTSPQNFPLFVKARRGKRDTAVLSYE